MVLYFLIKIGYIGPEAIIYKNVKTSEYPSFLVSHTYKAILKGLKISRIKIIKKIKFLDNKKKAF